MLSLTKIFVIVFVNRKNTALGRYLLTLCGVSRPSYSLLFLLSGSATGSYQYVNQMRFYKLHNIPLLLYVFGIFASFLNIIR